jgi:hypothetical protein
MAGTLEGVKLYICGQAIPFGLTSIRSSARCPVACYLLYRLLAFLDEASA